MTRSVAGLLAALLAAVALAQPSGAPLQGADLVAALKRGGYVLYFRHTSTDFAQSDTAMQSYEHCASQRNLTDAGRAEAREIGATIARLAIPVDTVLASPYCRTMETARLIFGRATASPAVRGGPLVADGDRYAELRALLARGAPAGSNVAIASHGNPFHAVAGPPYLAEGEMAVVAPGASNGFTVVARVRREAWADLAAVAR